MCVLTLVAKSIGRDLLRILVDVDIIAHDGLRYLLDPLGRLVVLHLGGQLPLGFDLLQIGLGAGQLIETHGIELPSTTILNEMGDIISF